MEELVELYDNIMFYLVVILFSVGWIMISIVRNYNNVKSPISRKYLEDGALRMLEADNRVILPKLTHVRFIVTAADVVHSFACPTLGIKCNAYPGRYN